MIIPVMIRKSLFLVSSLFIFSLTFAQNEESVTITTYYPSPYGVYHELRVDQMAIGSAYSNPSTYPLSDGNLIAAGTIQATGFNMAAGAGANKVLTSDDTGSASWQTAAGGGGGVVLGQTNYSWTNWTATLHM